MSAAERTAMSVSSERAGAAVPATRSSMGAPSPAARAVAIRNARRASAILVGLAPHLQDGQVARVVHHLLGQSLDGGGVAEGGQALRVRVDELLRPRAEGAAGVRRPGPPGPGASALGPLRTA